MNLTAEQIQENWNVFIGNIEKYISSPRKEKLIEFYEKYQERIMLMPAAHKKEYHNAFPGGYVEHVNRVVRCALKQAKLWKEEGADMDTFTIEELVFSAINHDLGKMGDEENESYRSFLLRKWGLKPRQCALDWFWLKMAVFCRKLHNPFDGVLDPLSGQASSINPGYTLTI